MASCKYVFTGTVFTIHVDIWEYVYVRSFKLTFDCLFVPEMFAHFRERSFQHAHRGDQHLWTERSDDVLYTEECPGSHQVVPRLYGVRTLQSSCGLPDRLCKPVVDMVAVGDHVRGYTVPESSESDYTSE